MDAIREHLLETLTALRSKTEPMAVDRAKAVADVARVLVETAKVEVDYMRVARKSGGTLFSQTRALPRGQR